MSFEACPARAEARDAGTYPYPEPHPGMYPRGYHGYHRAACQADWEECLQRRGLRAAPGRLELRVLALAGPPLFAPLPQGGGGGTPAIKENLLPFVETLGLEGFLPKKVGPGR